MSEVFEIILAMQNWFFYQVFSYPSVVGLNEQLWHRDWSQFGNRVLEQNNFLIFSLSFECFQLNAGETKKNTFLYLRVEIGQQM